VFSVRCNLKQDAVGDGILRPPPPGAATWRTRRYIGVVFNSGLFHAFYENMTSSTKPEVHNVSHCREKGRGTTTGNMYRKFGEIWTCFLRYWSGQTNKQTDIKTRWSQYLVRSHHYQGRSNEGFLVANEVGTSYSESINSFTSTSSPELQQAHAAAVLNKILHDKRE